VYHRSWRVSYTDTDVVRREALLSTYYINLSVHSFVYPRAKIPQIVIVLNDGRVSSVTSYIGDILLASLYAVGLPIPDQHQTPNCNSA